MLSSGDMANDVGSIVYGEEAVAEGLMDRVGTLSDALNALYRQMDRGDTVIYESERPTVEVDTVANSNGGEPMTPEQLYASNLASCVGITVSTTSVNIFGQTTTSAASGSGFVLTQDGYIVTNYHVIEDAAKDSSVSIEVSFADGKQYTAKLVGGEQDNDVAVLKIEASDLTPVKLGDSDQLVVGEGVYTIGNPLGELTYSLTDGLVSALDRLITTTSTNPSTGAAETTTLNVLQTNCDINPGNSGGPLFDSYGNVVGIVTAIGQAASYGWEDVAELLVLITINLGVFNLLPFPALDGGKIVFLLIEAVTGHAVPEKIQSSLTVAAFALLFGLMLFATYNDIVRLVTGAV